jgi:hypothetical protein
MDYAVHLRIATCHGDQPNLLCRQPGGLGEIPGFASPPHDGFALSDGTWPHFDRLLGGLEHSLSRLDTMVGIAGAVIFPQLEA